MENKLDAADKAITLLDRAYSVLFKVTSTRLGSGFVGVILSFAAVYFFWVETLKSNLTVLEKDKLNLNKDLSDCRKQNADVYERGRLAGRAEQEKYFEAAVNFAQRLNKDIVKEIEKDSKEVEILENKIKKRNGGS